MTPLIPPPSGSGRLGSFILFFIEFHSNRINSLYHDYLGKNINNRSLFLNRETLFDTGRVTAVQGGYVRYNIITWY
jgi:hypothetical protein